jgi:hypothetical protein
VGRIDYRPFVPAGGSPKILGANAREHTLRKIGGDRTKHRLFGAWMELANTPMTGITVDGTCIPGLFAAQPNDPPLEPMLAAASALLGLLSAEQRAAATFPIDSTNWRAWQNTEMLVEDHGLRLDEVPEPIREAALAVVRASLSASGYRATRDVMRLNGFLGELLGAEAILGEWSYLFVFFGTPHAVEPWGWQLFGHHLVLNCVVVNGQLVLSPTFLGAEPAYADVGKYAGTALFEDEERDGLALIRSLSGTERVRAILSHDIMAGDLPPGRRHFADNLHLAGAYQDNRIIPYEGLPAAEMSTAKQRRVLALMERYLAVLPPGPLAARMDEVERHLAQTHFCWIGRTGDDSPFYYRLQSPVVLIEFDHHIGVFLTNTEPQKFHVHTIVRTPNGNDYGIDILRQHYEHAHQRSHP